MVVHIADYHYVASFTITIWELLTHFDEDVKWIWLRPSTWIKWVFVLMRYGTLCNQSALLYQHFRSYLNPYLPSECPPWAVVRTLVPPILLYGTQSILISRVYALYDQNKRILVALLCILLLNIVWTFIMLVIGLSKATTYSSLCDPIVVLDHSTSYVTVILPFLLDLSIMALTIKKVFTFNRSPRNPLLALLLYDCLATVFAVWSMLTVTIIFVLSNQVALAYLVANTWYLTILSLAATRLILNLRRFSEESAIAPHRGPRVEGATSQRLGYFTSAVDLELSILRRENLTDFSTDRELR